LKEVTLQNNIKQAYVSSG